MNVIKNLQIGELKWDLMNINVKNDNKQQICQRSASEIPNNINLNHFYKF